MKQDGEAYVPLVQDLSKFRLPRQFRGASAGKVQLWWAVQATLFRWSPQIAYGFRAFLLRVFGAQVGHNTVIRPTVKITYPWKVCIGNYAWIGDDAVLYSLGDIKIGSHAVVSQRSYLCAADHDYKAIAFDIRSNKITIGPECWLAADVFVVSGVSIGARTVVGARSTVLSDLPSDSVCAGSPCRTLYPRI